MDQVEEVKRKVDIVELISEHIELKKAGRNFKGLCPFHSEKTPSFMVSQELQIFKCFGCFPAGELVKTPTGFHPIESLQDNNIVISGTGREEKVLLTHSRLYKGNLISIKLWKLAGRVTLTEDHRVFTLGGADYTKQYKNLARRLHSYNFYSKDKRNRNTWKYFPLVKVPASNLKKGMCLVYPVPTKVLDLDEVDLSAYVNKVLPPHGTKPKKIQYKVRVDDGFLKLIGYYIAEGSSHRAFVRFSLGDHEEVFAKEIMDLFNSIFGLKAGVHRRKGIKTGIEISICHSLLANAFQNLCGRGSFNKHIPYEFQYLPQEKQRVLLEAIHRGDGYRFTSSKSTKKFRAITTTSLVLSEQIRDIILRLGYFPNEHIEKQNVDKNNVSHKESYTINWSDEARSRYNLIYQDRQGNKYWLLPIRTIARKQFRGPVYNLTVQNDHSYVARNFAVANCGVGGDVFKFLMEYEKMDFAQALKVLAERVGVKLKPLRGFRDQEEKEEILAVNFVTSEFYHYLLTTHKVGQKARNYLKNRGISDESIKTFKLGFAPERPSATFNFLTQKRGYRADLLIKAGIVGEAEKRYWDRFRGRIIFPLFDHFGNVLGFAGRVIEEKGEVAKYINSPETLVYKKGQTLYGLSVTRQEIKRQKFAVVVEGEIDCISSWQAGVKNTVAIKGSAFTPQQAQLLSRFCSNIVLALDSDFAGDQAARRGLEVLQAVGIEIRIAELQNFKDPDAAARADAQMYKKAISEAEGVYDFLINSAFRRIDASLAEGKAKIGRELTPILASIEDEIVKAYCIKTVAGRLGVSEEAVIGQVAKAGRPRARESTQATVTKARPRQDLLEEHLLAVIFAYKPSLLLDKSFQLLIKSPLHRRIAHELNLFLAKKGSFDPSGFVASLPAELKEAFSSIFLSEVGIAPDPEAEIAKTQKELEILDSHAKIEEITKKIKALELTGEEQALLGLEEELARESTRLSGLE